MLVRAERSVSWRPGHRCHIVNEHDSFEIGSKITSPPKRPTEAGDGWPLTAPRNHVPSEPPASGPPTAKRTLTSPAQVAVARLSVTPLPGLVTLPAPARQTGDGHEHGERHLQISGHRFSRLLTKKLRVARRPCMQHVALAAERHPATSQERYVPGQSHPRQRIFEKSIFTLDRVRLVHHRSGSLAADMRLRG